MADEAKSHGRRTSVRNGEAAAGDLPTDPRTGKALTPRPQPGYYPDFSTLSQEAFWDEATRNVVRTRVENTPPIRFFTADEARLMEAVCNRVLPQDDRDADHRIAIVPTIDERLHSGRIDGYRYADMPSDREAHRLGLQGIEAMAHHLYGRSFIELGPSEQDSVLLRLHAGDPAGGDDIWGRLPVSRYWLLLVQDVLEAYYAHPYAWDEIGFGGPAYPRGYMRLEHGLPEPWEAPEQRYEWTAPASSLSGSYSPLGGSGEITSGQEGSH
ncbi:MAG TPA: gluconate 2-dehydrogenase subunit 3 family protein [Chloroflexota bacterium]|nr:gluconate 2-dehydrogenase subunit 3 family protein [Chloroflexota bacterium]